MSIKLDRLPRPGETILGGVFASAPGGKGANQAVAAARAGAAVTFVARIGRDTLGNQAVAALSANDIHLKHVIRDRANPSGVALIFIGRGGENSIAVAPGSNGYLTPGDLKKARKAFSQADVLLLQLEIPLDAVETAAEMAGETGLRIVLNPAPAQTLPPGLLRRAFVLTPNEIETELLTGIKLTDRAAVARAAGELLSQGPQNVVITLGSGGVYIAGKEGGHWIAAHKVDAVDTTAAGDVFNGVLAAALAEGKSLVEAAFLANAAAAISVTRMGAQPSAPSRAEIERMRTLAGPPQSIHRNGHHRLVPWKRSSRIVVN